MISKGSKKGQSKVSREPETTERRERGADGEGEIIKRDARAI
mgnify:CR=1 FL=1